jgi:sugar porter (SP) family MFS transporter
MVALIVAIYEIGCFIGAVITSFIGERLGRRHSVFWGVCIMLAGALLQATAYSKPHMIVARIVAGVGMGFINSTVPVIMAEFAPKATRGIYVCAQLSCLNFGIMMVYWIDYAFTRGDRVASFTWRVPVILQCVFLIPMLLIIMVIPDTPRWLVSHHRADEALDVLRRLNHAKMSDPAIVRMHQDIVNTVAYEASIGAGTWTDLLKSDDIQSRRRFLIACAVQIFQQLGGINALIYYSNTLFQESLGFDKDLSALMSGFLNTWFFAASFIPWFLIDRVGRRPLFLSMISLMAAVMVVQTGLIWNVQNKTSIAKSCGAGAAAMLFIFQGAFTVGFQATVWVYPSEILPLKLRQRGSSISTASNWICVSLFPPPSLASELTFSLHPRISSSFTSRLLRSATSATEPTSSSPYSTRCGSRSFVSLANFFGTPLS